MTHEIYNLIVFIYYNLFLPVNIKSKSYIVFYAHIHARLTLFHLFSRYLFGPFRTKGTTFFVLALYIRIFTFLAFIKELLVFAKTIKLIFTTTTTLAIINVTQFLVASRGEHSAFGAFLLSEPR